MGRIAKLMATLALAGMLGGLAGCETVPGSAGSGSAGSASTGAGGTAAGGSPAASGGGGSYGLFSDAGDRLDELVEAGEYEEAARLIDAEPAFFAANRDDHRESFESTAEHFNGLYEPRFSSPRRVIEIIGWPAGPDRWSDLREALAAARTELAAYDSYGLLRDPAYRAPEAEALAARAADLTARAEADADASFAAYPHFAGRSFFAAYPVELDAKAVMARNFAAVEPGLKAADPAQFESFLAAYPPDAVMTDGVRARVGTLYAVVAGPGAAGGLAGMLDTARRSDSLGLGGAGAGRLAFVEVTSPSLLRGGQIEFPVEVALDIPVRAAKSDLESALSAPGVDEADYVVVFDVALAKATRKVGQVERVRSEYVSGTVQMPNPEYDIALSELRSAEDNLAIAKAQGLDASSSLLALALSQILETPGDRLNDARDKLRNTPVYRDEPVYDAYAFEKARLRSRKNATVHYYVIDKPRGTYFKSTFDLEEERSFTVAYNLHPEDRNFGASIASTQTESEVVDWEEAPVEVRLSELMAHYAGNRGGEKPLPSETALRREMVKDKNRAIESAKAETYTASAPGDPRFDHVVVVQMPGGGLGTGFYIRPNVVMTNWHVVEGGNFVELTLFDGRESFGKVIASDARLDLALIQVEARGKPVALYDRSDLPIGSELEIIGHPRGLAFTFTRGVVSAVRRGRSVNIPGAADVLLVQTDAAISPGNSGGPWFVGDRVVAVTSFMNGAEHSQNLNFGIHYGEVREFLQEYLPAS